MGAKLSFPRVQLTTDRIFVVTGANRGIGYETAKWLAMMGGHVIMACRSEDLAVQAMRRMDAEYKEEKQRGTAGIVDVEELSLEFMKLDTSSFQSTKEFVEAYKKSDRPLHVLICNAGVSKAKPEKTEDGFETMLQVNYLSHFLLIGKLLPLMRKSGDSVRIVLVSSDAHKLCRFNMDTMNFEGNEEKFGFFDYYGRSKLYQIMQMHCLHRRLLNTNIKVYSLHPGTVETDIGREFKDSTAYKVFLGMSKLVGLMKNQIEGAETVINCAVNSDIKCGAYYKDCKEGSTSSVARDEDKQEEVWRRSMEYVKDHLSEDEIFCLQGADP